MLFVDWWFSVNVDPLICGNEKQRCVIMGTGSAMGKNRSTQRQTKPKTLEQKQPGRLTSVLQRLKLLEVVPGMSESLQTSDMESFVIHLRIYRDVTYS